jgi:hypothetical protein
VDQLSGDLLPGDGGVLALGRLRGGRGQLPSASRTTQWWCVLPMSVPAHIRATVSSGRSMCTVVPDDLAGVVLLSDTAGVRIS